MVGASPSDFDQALAGRQAGAAPGADAGAAGGGQAKDDVIDAEFREVDDDKKKS